ncbi:MAG TPA: helix-turn-helix domain-containing protein [Candidatus Eisenbergiella merdigallinarum]|uniref:Helix-turn-helix domain-containing protein n=1 Tax=Candidatus Eisenbergiella merdigallinarum TaxID=2838552 RepID=A0A9D2MQJ1_9FIRM|nr:helix-turn-helix domain-containing protein [Candidatus Eisenbergiella merdigallinarum]
MKNTVSKTENLLPFPVISAAVNGDTTAMCVILKHYEGYIAKLCTRTLKDDAGNLYSFVDEEMRNRLQVRLITRTLAFRIG